MNNWIKAYFCVGCKQELTFGEVVGSKGICPKCGNINNTNIVKNFHMYKRIVNKKSWWQFWKEDTYEFKEVLK